jgi:hypothetical protein
MYKIKTDTLNLRRKILLILLSCQDFQRPPKDSESVVTPLWEAWRKFCSCRSQEPETSSQNLDAEKRRCADTFWLLASGFSREKVLAG